MELIRQIVLEFNVYADHGGTGVAQVVMAVVVLLSGLMYAALALTGRVFESVMRTGTAD